MGYIFRLIFQILILPIKLVLLILAKLRTFKKVCYVKIEISGPYPESPPLKGWLSFLKSKKIHFYELILELNSLWHFLKTRKGKSIKKIFFVIKSPEIGWARAWELREIILQIREVTETEAFLYSGNHISYYLATACHKITVLPALHLELFPISIEQLYYRNLLDRFGIRPNFLQIGEYKSFAEIFTRKEPSNPNAMQLKELIGQIQKYYLEALQKRNPKVNLNFLEQNPILSAQKALSFKLIDGICYEKDTELKEKIFSLAEVLRIFYYQRKKLISLKKPKPIALLVAEGPIVESEESLPQAITDFDYVPTLEEIAEKNYSAVICRIHSPGGSALVSDILWQKIYSLNHDLKEDPFGFLPENQKKQNQKEENQNRTKKIPVYISLSDVAASGGYYLSAGGEKIYASPLTITGSIGVIAGKFNIAPLAKKFGIHHHEISLAKKGNFYSLFSDFNQTEQKALKENMKTLYELFLHRVLLGRNLKKEELEKIAKGRVYSGEVAKKIGLIDETKSLFAIIEKLRKELNIKSRDFLEIEILPTIKPSLRLKKFLPFSVNQKKIFLKNLQKNIFWFIDLNFLK